MTKGKRSWYSPSVIIDRYFLEEQNPYSKRRPVRMKVLIGASSIVLVAFVLSVLFFGGRAEEREKILTQLDMNGDVKIRPSLTNQGVSIAEGESGRKTLGGEFPNGGGRSGAAFGSSGGGRGFQTQTRSANQVIRRGAQGSDPGAQIPMGEGIPARLLNSILSNDSASPAIAEVTQDIFIHGTLSIPQGTRVIGSAQYNEASSRIQLRFGTLVYPEGDQHTIQALGMMPDGTAGLEGEYHSGEEKRQVGRLLGHFIAGTAAGMKERKSGGMFGGAIEPGSIKNGVLNGVTLSAADQAKAFSSNLNATKASMTLPAGQSFLLFLEREYVP